MKGDTKKKGSTGRRPGFMSLGTPVPEAGRLAAAMQLGGTSEELARNLRDHDLSTGAADCGCVVFDYQFWPCDKHDGRPKGRGRK